jgi:membrane protein
MQRLVSASPDGLGVGALVGIVVALWSANKGTKGLVKAIKVAHDTEEHRGFVRLNVVTLGFTLASIVIVGVILAIVAGIPALLGIVGIDQVARTVIDALRWPLLAIVLLFAIGALYRWGGSRRQQPWVTPGSVLATVALLIASALFSFYVSRFDSFVTTYGSLAAVAIMMLWLFIGAYAVLLGAEIDAEVSRQVRATGSSQAEARKTA